jgi:hypothetical protein
MLELDALDRYGNWVARTFPPGSPEQVTARTADPDRDDLPNFVEYALALLPLSPDAGLAYFADPAAPGTASVFFNLRLTDPAEIRVTAEASSDLANWSSSDVFLTVVADSGGVRTMRATDTRPPGTARHRAIRLRVTGQP